MKITLGEKRDNGRGAWYREATVGGIMYRVSMSHGKRVRIPYKPRGPGAYGFHWYGLVRDADGHRIWSGRAPKSLGVRGMLIVAGVIES